MILSGSPLDLVKAFIGGILLSFTPCVYPLIPITVGYIGIRSGGSRRRGLALSLTYVTGIAITYSFLGLAASLTGRMFGSISSNPATIIIVGLIIIFFGLYMYSDFIFLSNFVKSLKLKNKGHFSVLLLGLNSGLLISPCVSGVLGSILAVLFTKRNIVYGMTLLMSFAYGMGLILILVGTFSSVLLHLPKSGKWMVYINRACAFALIGYGLYVVYNGIGKI